MDIIIEKLGIKPVERIDNPDTITLLEIREVERQRNKMLTWLIKDLLVQDVMGGLLPNAFRDTIEKKFGKEVADWIEEMKPIQIEIVEESCGEPWEKIKRKLK